jgi:hypothetical protein
VQLEESFRRVIQTHKGSIIRIIQSYTMLTKEPTIHYPCQFEWYKNDAKDKSIIVPGGRQHIQTVVGYPTPLNIKDGLSHFPLIRILITNGTTYLMPFVHQNWNGTHLFLIMMLGKMSSGEKYQPLSPSVMRLVTTLSFMMPMRQN